MKKTKKQRDFEEKHFSSGYNNKYLVKRYKGKKNKARHSIKNVVKSINYIKKDYFYNLCKPYAIMAKGIVYSFRDNSYKIIWEYFKSWS